MGINEEKIQVIAKIAVLVGVLAVSFAAIFVRWSAAPALITAMYRLLFAALLTCGVIFTRGKANFKAFAVQDMVLAMGSGVFLALHFYSWFVSLELTSVASSTVLVTMQPIFVVAGEYLLFRERVTPLAMLGIAISLTGSIFIGLGGSRELHRLYGDVLALLGALLVSVYLLIGRSLRKRVPMLEYTLVVYSTSTVVLLVLALVSNTPLHGYPAGTWLVFFLLALVPTMLGHSLFNWALKYLETSYISVNILGEPVGATVLAWLFFGEVPSVSEAVGGALILAGLYLFHQKRGINHNSRA